MAYSFDEPHEEAHNPFADNTTYVKAGVNKDLEAQADAYLRGAGLAKRGVEAEGSSAAKRAVEQIADQYTPVYAVQFGADVTLLKGLADRFHRLGADMKILQAGVSKMAREEIEVAAKIAMDRVEEDRKRKGWAARAMYTDRHGMHHLQNAIWESVRTQPMGDGFEFVGFDIATLNRMTLPGKGGSGYWKDYEEGSRGGYIMPRGIWVGPGESEGGRKPIKEVASGDRNPNRGVDRFYPKKGGMGHTDRYGNDTHMNKKTGEMRNNSGVFAHQKANPVLSYAIAAISEDIAVKLTKLTAEYLDAKEQAQAHEPGGGITVFDNSHPGAK